MILKQETLSNNQPELELKFRLPETDKPRLVVIGGGFAGLNLIRNLKDADLQIVLIDRNNYHTFIPLLYQVSTAGLDPDSIASPFRKVLAGQKNVFFRVAEVEEIRPEEKSVVTHVGALSYDYLVIATGSRTNFFGLDDVSRYAMPLKSVPQALNLRSLILQNFEKALMETDPDEFERLSHIIVVGAGPTGVELCGALGELKNFVLPKDYPELNFEKLYIHLVEMKDRVLPTMSPEASKYAHIYLENLTVDVRVNRTIKSYDGNVVVFKNGEEIHTNTVVWAAGVKGALLKGIPEDLIEFGRCKVDSFNRLPGFEDLFVIGDLSNFRTEDYPNGLPMVATVAIQQGSHLAHNLKRLLAGGEMIPYEYTNKGYMATIGRKKAVADLPNLKVHGFFAWILWLVVHIYYLIGFRNKISVFIDWTYNYMRYEMGNRLIIRPFPDPKRKFFKERAAGQEND